MNTNERELLINRRPPACRAYGSERNRENEGYRFWQAGRILCFLRCLLFAFFRQSSSSPLSCAFVSISGLDFVNLPRQTRLRGKAVRESVLRKIVFSLVPKEN